MADITQTSQTQPVPQASTTLSPTPSVLPTTTANVQNFLQSYQPTAQQVYSPTNVQQATTAPAAAPNLADPMGLYSYYMNTPEVTQAQKDYQALQQRLSSFDTGTQQANIGLENQPVSLNVIRGEQAQLGQQAAATRQGLASQALVAQSAMEAARQTAQEKLNLALSQRSELTNLITQFPGAKISYADNVEEATKKINKYQEEQTKQAYKDSLKQAALQLGIKTKGSTKDIEKRLQKYYGSEAATKKVLQDLEIAAKRKANATPAGGTAVSQGITLANAQNALLGSRGTDGKVDPTVYTTQRAEYLKKGGTADEFDKQFGGLLSSKEQSNLGVGTTSQKPPTQAQYTVAGYAQRVADSGQQIDNLGNKVTDMNPVWFATQRSLPSFMQSSEMQQYDQASRNLINAILRRESGAAISASEFENAYAQYLPKPGDSPEVIAQKKRNRDAVLGNYQAASGGAYQGQTQVSGEQDINDILSQFNL